MAVSRDLSRGQQVPEPANSPYQISMTLAAVRPWRHVVISALDSTVCPSVFRLSVFLRATAVPAGTVEARISYGDSVCLSVRPSRSGGEPSPGEIETPGSSPYGSLDRVSSF